MDEEILTQAIRNLILEAAPERRIELEELSLQFAHAGDKEGFEIGGGPWGLIPFTPRTMGQIWLLGFAAWRALEAYCPYILLCSEIVPSAMSDAPGQADADKALAVELAKFEELRTVESIEAFSWPLDIPEPSAVLPTAVKERAIVDSIKLAAAYVFLHETRHVMFEGDPDRPADERDEEIACDRFARDFLLEKIADYNTTSGYGMEAILNKRVIGLALGAFILLKITKDKNGSASHPPIASRLRELVQRADASTRWSAWIYACCLLLSVLRREARLPSRLTFSDPSDLFEKMTQLLEA